MNNPQPKQLPPQSVTVRQAFWYWLKLGFISFGGPAGQISIMHQDLVEQKHWISERRFLHALNYCMLLPGPEAQQLAIYIGWLMHRTWGGLIAGLLFILPSLFLLILLSWIYIRFGQLPEVAAVLYGIKPAVTAIVLFAAHRIGSRALKNGVIFEQIYQQNIRKKDLTNFVSDLVDNKPVVIRYGINPSALGVVVGQPLDKKALHPIEESLLQLAGEYLNKVPHAELVLSKESKLYPNNVVLVDIFVREDGKIKQDESSNKPETHTIALWRKKELEILLIDPSRVDFSKELIGNIKSVLKVEVKLHSPTGGVIYGTGGKETGYSELKSTTIAVDIATKIGFEINELQIDENVLSLEQIERAINLQISNQKQVATYLTNTSHGQPNRASQSTDVNVRRDNRQVLELMK